MTSDQRGALQQHGDGERTRCHFTGCQQGRRPVRGDVVLGDVVVSLVRDLAELTRRVHRDGKWVSAAPQYLRTLFALYQVALISYHTRPLALWASTPIR